MRDDLRVALIVSFYLSKYDKSALEALGYSSFNQAFDGIGQRMGVKRNTIKGQRDEFDPIHDNNRVGWCQREMQKSRVQVVQMFDDLSFGAMTSLVRNLLAVENHAESKEAKQVLSGIDEDKGEAPSTVFTPRSATGRKAEEHFMRWFAAGVLPFQGTLQDRRDDGCGYDFLIRGFQDCQVEVKGLAAESGGILLTDKEWQTANQQRGTYSLFVVSHLDSEPQWTIIPDPATALKPTMAVRTVVQVSWQVGAAQLAATPKAQAAKEAAN